VALYSAVRQDRLQVDEEVQEDAATDPAKVGKRTEIQLLMEEAIEYLAHVWREYLGL
jgi:hypothetical protein